MSLPTPTPAPLHRPRGFAMLIAVAMAAVLLSIVFAMQSMVASTNRARVAEKHVLLARQAAEAGLARARSDALRLTGTLQQSDLDCLLDPKLDSPDPSSNVSDNNLPPSTTPHTRCSSLLAAWSDTSVESVNGQNYRKILLDMDGDGTNDGAYMVRYDDNRDDLAPNPGPEATNNNPNVSTEGVEDTPTRDRDMTIMVSVIGLSGGTTFDSALSRRLLRATLRGQGGVAFVTPGRASLNQSGGASGVICGAGALFCMIGESTGRTPECACGRIVTDDNDGEVWPSAVPQCSVPSQCQSCEPLQVVNDDPTACSVPPPPLPASLDLWDTDNAMTAARFNNFRAVANTCYFYVDKSAGFDHVYMFDTSRAGCTTFGSGDDIPVPSPIYNAVTPTIEDCWVPVFSSNPALGLTVDNNGGDWQPGISGGNRIPTLDLRPLFQSVATATFLSTSAISPKTYADLCGQMNPASGKVIDFNGASATLITSNTDQPQGIFFFSGDYTNVYLAGGGGPRRMGVLAQGNVYWPSGLHLQNPVRNLHAIATGGGCYLGSGSGGRLDYGIWCDNFISYQTNDFKVNGDMLSRGDIANSGSGNNIEIAAGVAPGAAFPTAYTDCPSIARINGDDCEFKNGAIFCANISCRGDVETKNNNAVYGTIYAGGDIELGNNVLLQPPASSMLGATPTITTVQDIGL